MAITLYPHNQTAYDSALSMLVENGKAAVIHPTGTGKSFIGFKLAEQHQTARICWGSPSEYIFKTQLENLIQSGAANPGNIEFLTYTKLMLGSDDFILDIKPDYIVLDEFHRCGAAEWGKGVKRLLNAYPDTPILGLSATNIRYLDNRRDMADELFDGYIASEMSLGEAIVRNILLPPTYVLSVYTYQKELEYYQRKADSARNSVIRENSRLILEKLRRAIAEADGLDVIFEKHMKNKTGKYLVFCSGVEHMLEIEGYIGKWFHRVDKEPKVYKVYADEPSSNEAFAAFKADESEHLKLLLCVDMLNEGVHVENISGVIMFRPTVSPIIYKQQLGRALSASKTKQPIVFDVVNNIDCLNSIASVHSEMERAIEELREYGESEYIINKNFMIIDEVRDCRILFEALNSALDATWDAYYELAMEYHAKYGHLDIPTTYQHKGMLLGKWIYSQRRIRNGEVNGFLSSEQIQKLEKIGMLWQPKRDMPWTIGIEHAKAYREAYGNLLVPVEYVSPDGYRLGNWISTLRHLESKKERRGQLSSEKVQQLNELGMVWNRFEYSFEKNFAEAEKYYKEHGNLVVTAEFETISGFKLGRWLNSMRSARRGSGKALLTEDRIARLDMLGMQWNVRDELWEKCFSEAEEYYMENNTLRVNHATKTKSGFKLGQWLYYQKLSYIGYKGRRPLTPDKISRLEGIGMVWDLANVG